MPDKELVADHYTHGSLLEGIRAGVSKLGKSESEISIDDLAPVEEFHIGGRIASADFLDQLALSADQQVLDVGCGLGGSARFAASRYGCAVTGVDLTEEFVATGRVLNEWVGLQDKIVLEQGSALAMNCAGASFERAYMMHVGMNIADKAQLAKEIYRVLKPGGRLGIFDIMKTSAAELTFPVPWATEANGSALGSLEDYQSVLQDAGFSITAQRNRREFAIDFFAKLQAATLNAQGPPPLGLHIVMGSNAAQKIANMVENVKEGRIAPVEVFAVKEG